ncbi:hypothetical protein TIFTF001_030600 [Ficus carica]|uniref:Uncharacterized protein n=1 Tax=Ficus carica TaxID=3494 RepID=A0AA88DTP4_FICCA|nr:hypothetical protein TIFTF001_030600 [Ficus carica]
MSKISGTIPEMITRRGQPCTITLHLVACKKEAARSNRDTGGVSVTGTSILKLAMVLMSKQRGRALTSESCPYLNKWANPVFIGILCGLGCSGDLVGLNSECSRRVDMLQVHRHRGNRPALGAKVGARTGPVAGSVSGARRHRAMGTVCYAMVKYSSDPGSVAWSGVAGPKSDQLVVRKGDEQYTGDGGRSIRFPGKGSIVVGEVLPGSTQWVSIVVRSWSTTENIRLTRWWSFKTVPGEGFSSYRGNSARVNTKSLDSGPLVAHDGEHRTNLMVVVQHNSRGRFSSCRGSSARVNTKGLDSGPLVVHDEEHLTNSMVVV